MKVHMVIPDGVVPTLCRMCDTRCAINVHIRDEVITEITPFGGHPVNQGRMCPRGGAAIDLFYHPDRISRLSNACRTAVSLKYPTNRPWRKSGQVKNT